MTATSIRPLRFVGDSLEVLRELSAEVKNEIGFALERVQRGKMPENAKPLKGIAPGVLEIVSDFRGDMFRAVYTVRFQGLFTFCMCSRRSPNEALRHRSMKWSL
jgi:phage-related protein